MREFVVIGALVGLMGCAPPNIGAGGVRGVTIISPTPDQVEIELTPEGTLDLVIAIDVDGFSFRTIGQGEAGNQDQGHWHLYVNNAYEGAIPWQATEYVQDNVADGTPFSVRAVLATDDHQEIFDDGGPVQSAAEFTAVAFGSLQ